jgi:hypothetical protein
MDVYMQCNLCGKILKNIKGLAQHYRQNHPGKWDIYSVRKQKERINLTYKCEICGFLAVNKKGLYGHISKIHKKSPKEYYDIYLKDESDGICKNPSCNKITSYHKSGKYLDFCYNCARSFDDEVLKIKYGFEWKQKKIEILKRYSHNLDFYIEKYGETKGIEFYNKWRKDKAVTLNKMIEKYGDINGLQKFIQWKISAIPQSVSMESLVVFWKVLDWLFDGEYCEFNDVFWGIPESKEYFLYDKRIYFYDFTIPKFKLIIEYHGESFHPNPNWNINKLESWQQLYTKKTAKTILEFDKKKKQVAQKNGFDILEIYSSNKIETNFNLCKEFIYDCIKRYC